MRITSVALPGFGRLSDFSRELAPGLNVFAGYNEAGKSTLQQAICALLYGFYDGERSRPDEAARHVRFRPWAGGPYRGSMQYELDDGRRFEVRRDFGSQDVLTQVIDAVTGTDVSGEFGRGRHGNVPFARKHLGMSRAVFQSCAFISQGEIFEIGKAASPSEIGDAIAALADSARRDVSAARAIDRLGVALTAIGSDRARTAKLPVARDALARATSDLEAATRARRDAAEKAARLEDAQKHHRELAQKAVALDYLVHRGHASTLEGRIEASRKATDRATAAEGRLATLAPRPGLTAGLRDQVLALSGALERGRESLSRLRQLREDASSEIGPEEQLEFEALRSGSSELPEDQRRALEAILYQSPPPSGLLARLARAFKAVFRAVRRLLPGRGEPRTVEARPPVTRDEARAMLDRHQRYLALRPAAERLESIERQLVAEMGVANDTEAQALAALLAAGIEGGPLESALAAFDRAWAEHEAYNAAVEERDGARREASLLLHGATLADLEATLAERSSAAQALLERHPGLSEISAHKPLESLERDLAHTRDAEHRAEMEASRLGEEVRLSLESHRSRAELEEEVAASEAEVRRLERSRAALALARSTIEEAMTQVYRDFAPAVNSFLSEGIEFVTEGRYRRVHVDPSTLKVSLLVPETDQVLTDPPVSHGTRTLIYVLMRIGLAQHMSAIGESVPLVLDDPFVDLDSRRHPLVLDFLLRLSERMQILLFTRDETVLDWLADASPGVACRAHEMGDMAPARL